MSNTALISHLKKVGYLPPQNQQQQPAGQGGGVDALATLLGGGAPGGAGAMGAPQGMPQDAGMGGGAPPDMGMGMGMGMGTGMDMGMPTQGAPVGGQAPPPTPEELSAVSPDVGQQTSAVDPKVQVQSALAILKEGIKQLEKALDSLLNPEAAKQASYSEEYNEILKILEKL